jgi:hypothetical protein
MFLTAFREAHGDWQTYEAPVAVSMADVLPLIGEYAEPQRDGVMRGRPTDVVLVIDCGTGRDVTEDALIAFAQSCDEWPWWLVEYHSDPAVRWGETEPQHAAE